jgi:hypothetical protein
MFDASPNPTHLENPGIRLAQSCATEARRAVEEFHAGVAQPDMELVIFFCSSRYDLNVVADEMQRSFAGIQVVGCTTAGGIGPDSYHLHCLAGASFAANVCTAVAGRLQALRNFEGAQGTALIQDLLQRLEGKTPLATPDNTFAFLLIDGLSVREEPVALALQHALGKVPLIGGSAGDDQRFSQTFVYSDGQFQADGAVVTLVSTPLPFQIFMSQHFVATEDRLVVTASDPARRIVYEINGLPAAEEYARLIGSEVSDLNPMRFAAWPVVVVIGGTNYVRSIQKVNADGGLTFYCAIEEGLVLRLARGVDLAENLAQTFAKIEASIGSPQIVLGCDCILRQLEMLSTGVKGHVETLFRSNHMVGFSSYGEQFRGVHVNQTFTGIAIGTAPKVPNA